MSELVVVKKFKSRYEAELARGFLESHGIEADVSADDAGGMYPQLTVVTGGVRLLVKDIDMLKAKALLTKKTENNDAD